LCRSTLLWGFFRCGSTGASAVTVLAASGVTSALHVALPSRRIYAGGRQLHRVWQSARLQHCR
jgi:hypothetical protein